MNRAIITGRLTRDPETKQTQSDSTVVRFSVAVDRRFKRDGEPTADFFNCVAFGKTAEFVQKYFAKAVTQTRKDRKSILLTLWQKRLNLVKVKL